VQGIFELVFANGRRLTSPARAGAWSTMMRRG
jgi:hypothetical protein